MSQTKAQLVSGTSAQDLTVDNINTTSINNGQTGRKNFIINGACAIDQRNNGSAVTANYAIDRTHIEGFTGGGTGTAQRVTDSPSGFYYSLKVTVTGTDTSLAATDYYTLRHIIEGSNIAHLGFGASGGTSVTLSFFVKSSVTGIFCAGLGNGSNDRTMPKEYTIDAADTWEKKTLTFPADTTGTWGADANRGFSIRWCMGVGSSRQGTADTYNGMEAHGTANQTNLFATNAATFQITGMQLEAGTTATDFEHRSIGEELELCKRYYNSFGYESGVTGAPIVNFMQNSTDRIPIPQLSPILRAAPTVTGANPLTEFSSGTSRSVSSYQSVGASGGGYIQLGAACSNPIYVQVKFNAEM
tara:strand:- start:208 stop:1281 length:1074 start_codon:yes stop_codon:yes gene_type:complete